MMPNKVVEESGEENAYLGISQLFAMDAEYASSEARVGEAFQNSMDISVKDSTESTHARQSNHNGLVTDMTDRPNGAEKMYLGASDPRGDEDDDISSNDSENSSDDSSSDNSDSEESESISQIISLCLQGSRATKALQPVNTVQVKVQEKLYKKQQISGKGCGLVAVTDIKRGTLIMSEYPLIKVDHYQEYRSTSSIVNHLVASKIDRLSSKERRHFFKLANVHPASPPNMGILWTNCFMLGPTSGGTAGLFLEISRLNHSCRPNADHVCDGRTHRMAIHAIKDIKAGEEITISYYQDVVERSRRQLYLKRNFRFDCSCELCSLPKAEQLESDKRAREIGSLIKAVKNRVSDMSPASLPTLLHTAFNLSPVHRLLHLLREDGIHGREVAQMYENAFHMAVAARDVARAKMFAEKAKYEWVMATGKDGREHRRRRLMEDNIPDGDGCNTSQNAVSEGMSEGELDDWLWGRHQDRDQ